MPALLLLISLALFAAGPAAAHRCTLDGPPDLPLGTADLTVPVGGTTPYTIFGGDLAEFTVLTGSTLVAVSPTFIAEATDGNFVFVGLNPGNTQIDILWAGLVTEDNPEPTSGTCRVDVLVTGGTTTTTTSTSTTTTTTTVVPTTTSTTTTVVPTTTTTTTSTTTTSTTTTVVPTTTTTTTSTSTTTTSTTTTVAPTTTTTLPSAVLDLSAFKSHAPGTFRIGGEASYRIRISNVGTVATQAPITVTDELPAELEYVAGEGAGWSCPPAPAGPTIVCTHPGPLGPGEFFDLTLRVHVRSDAVPRSQVVNTATVRTDGDSNAENDTSTNPTTLTAAPDLAIEKSASGPFASGTFGIYRIRVTNVGSAPARGFTKVSDVLPPEVKSLGVRSELFKCSTKGQEVTCFSVAGFVLFPGESTEIEIKVGVVAEAPALAVNRALLNPAGVPDPNPTNHETPPLSTPIVAGLPLQPPCGTTAFEGWMEPSQGVWQDDDTFADQPTKQLRRLAARLFAAELAMVKGRDTLLFGIFRPVGEAPEDRRDRIVFKGEAGGETVDVRARFVLEQGNGRRLLWISEPFAAPLGGACVAASPFEIALDASQGIPPPGQPPFRFDEEGIYEIVGDLIREDGSATGLEISVIGTARDTGGLTVHFVPASFFPIPIAEVNAVEKLTQTYASLSDDRIPDYMPVAPGAVKTKAQTFRNLGRVVDRVDAEPNNRIRLGTLRSKALAAELALQMQTGGLLAGADRVGVVLGAPDYVLIAPERSAAFAISNKVFFLKDPIYFLNSDVDTVYHEIVHTIPFPWAEEQMLAECGLDWHNEPTPVAHGHRILLDGRERRRRERSQPGVMSAELTTWTSQCTYWHILEQLTALPDPELLLVQGRVLRDPVDPFGQLFPFYEVLGDSFQPAGPGGDWALSLRDAGGAELARVPFAPGFEDSKGIASDLAPFSFRVLPPPGLARVDLLGPGDRVLDSVSWSANPPTLAITAPADGSLVPPTNRHVTVHWEAEDPDGEDVLTSVLYSDDGGASWQTVAFELEEAQFDVPVAARREGHRVRAIVSDGARSAEAEVGFTLDLEESADLGVAVETTPPRAIPGGELLFSLQAENAGPTDASAAVLTAELPDAAQFVTASPGCTEQDGRVSCTLGTLPPGAVVERAVVVAVSPAPPGPLASRVEATASEPDQEPANDAVALVTPLAALGSCPDAGVSPTATVGRGAVVDPSARVCDRAELAPTASVAEEAFVGEAASLGRAARLERGATLERGASLAARARLGTNAFLGRGSELGRRTIVEGESVLEVDVVVGPRSALGAGASIARGVRLGRAVEAGAGLVVGEGTTVEDRVVFGAGVRVGRHVRIGAGSTIGDHVLVPDDSVVPSRTEIPERTAFE